MSQPNVQAFTSAFEEVKPAGPVISSKKLADDTFHLALTMAGAVSAGAYTGGVLDYLFEALDNFERAKQGDFGEEVKNLTPSHNVVIEAMGGASAGGMTTVMSALYALSGKVNPVKHPGTMHQRKDNIFYDSWVLLDDDPPGTPNARTTMEKALDTSDLKTSVRSLLNSAFIDRIAERAVPDQQPPADKGCPVLPPYISPDLDVLLSHAMLQGVPLEVRFDTERFKDLGFRAPGMPYHTTYEHFLVSHYKLGDDVSVEKNGCFHLDPYDKEKARQLRLATIATGAFPMGLEFREFAPHHMSHAYIGTNIKRILTRDFSGDDPAKNLRIALHKDSKHSLATVDGGTLNNEPYAEVLSVIRKRFGGALQELAKDTLEKGHKRIGVVMIDPFPDVVVGATEDPPKDLIDVLPRLIRTLREQSKVKREEMVDQFEADDHYRGQIYPAKAKLDANGKRTGIMFDHPIACASVGAFGGFLDMSFRQHDFFLGRNNARNFIRAYFSFPYHDDPAQRNPIHRDPRWQRDGEMFKRFVYKDRQGREYLPILPDVNLLIDRDTWSGARYAHYDIHAAPQFDARKLFRLKGAMEKRVLRIIELLSKRVTQKIRGHRSEVADDWMSTQYAHGIRSRIRAGVINICTALAFRAAKRGIARKMVRSAIAYVLRDLERMELLQRREG